MLIKPYTYNLANKQCHTKSTDKHHAYSIYYYIECYIEYSNNGRGSKILQLM